MTEPLTPDQLAELRQLIQDHPDGLVGAQVASALIGEIDRLTAENERLDELAKDHWRESEDEFDRRATAEAALAQTRAEFSFARTDKPDLALWCTPVPEASARSFMADYATRHPDWRFALMRRTVGPWTPVTEPPVAQDDPQPDAERPSTPSATPEAPEAPTGPHGPAEGFEYGYENMDRSGEGPMMIGYHLDGIRENMRLRREAFPEVRYALRRRPVGAWETIEDDYPMPLRGTGRFPHHPACVNHPDRVGIFASEDVPLCRECRDAAAKLDAMDKWAEQYWARRAQAKDESATAPVAVIRWHHGPTDTDPDPGKRWCYTCGGEVWSFKDGASMCTNCNGIVAECPTCGLDVEQPDQICGQCAITPEEIVHAPELDSNSNPTDYALCGGDGRLAHNTWRVTCEACLGWCDREITPEDEGIATTDVHAQTAADQRAYCPDCGLPETNCACG